MSKKSVFDLDPEQLNQLLSIGKEPVEPVPQESSSSPEVDQAAQTASLNVFIEKPGDKIGRYKLLSILGEGGMGMVYLAEQEGQIRRKVALKIIKPGMDSKRVIARFETERQALALLDHPGIAQVYDAGTTQTGRPYFVMEHVRGLPITDYCDRHKLTVEERLRLFQQICLAVHHAHQKGIIHRDIKPSNILVSAENDRPIPKIIDFGVAKAISQPLTERTLFTEDSHLLGTPEYMSPEQADMSNEDIDTRSDIYSLGVLLYVLLAGILPYDPKTFRQGGVEHIRRIIRETDPKTPSTRLMKLGEEATAIANNRRMEIHTLARHLRKELEWIPLKAMRKERSARYRSASELADDIENYLNREPLMAGPPGTGYKLKKFVRRNCVLVGGIAAVLAVLIAGVVVSTIFAAGQARALVDNQLITDFLQNDVLGSAAKARIGEATAIYMLDAASNSLEDKFRDKPLIEAAIREKLAWTYRLISEPNQAEQHFLRAADIYRQHYGEEHADTLRAMSDIGWVYMDQGRFRDMEDLWLKCLQITERVLPVRHQLGAMNSLGVARLLMGKYKEAELLFKRMIDLDQREWRGKNAGRFTWFRGNLADVYRAQGRYDEAEQLLKEILRTFARPEDEEGTYPIMHDLADTYREQGRYVEAETLLEQTLESQRLWRGSKSWWTLRSMYTLARVYTDHGRYDKAKSLFDEALPITRERLRRNHPLKLRFVNAYAVLHTKQKQYDKAQSLFNEALEGTKRELGDDHPYTLETINDLGILHRQQQHYEQAERLLTQALEGIKVKLGPDHPHTLQSMHELAVLYKEQARYEDAEPLLLEALEGRRLKLGDSHPHTIESLNNLIDLYEAWNKPEEAKEWRAKLPETEAARE